MKHLKNFLLLLLAILGCGPVYAKLKGQAKLDSLLQELPKATGGTNNIKLLTAIANAYRRTDYAEAVKYGRQSVALAGKLDMKKGISTSNYCLGNIYSDHSDWGNALKCYNAAIAIEQNGDDKVAIASLLNNIAATYNNLSDHPKSLEINLKALKLFEETGDKNGTANCHINIGGTYTSLQDYAHAVAHFQMALAIYKETASKVGIALALNNLGDTYTHTPDYTKALNAFEEAYNIYIQEGAVDGEDMALSNIASIYIVWSDYKQALENGFNALTIARNNELAEGMGYDYKVISEAYFGIATNDSAKKTSGAPYINKATALKLAKAYIDSSFAVFSQIGALGEMAIVTELSSKIDYAAGNYKGAYKNYELYKKLNDSVFNLEKDKKLTQTAMQYDFDKKEALAKGVQNEKNIRQRNIRNFMSAGLLCAVVFP